VERDFSIFLLLLNNISIFVVLIVGYSFLLDVLRRQKAHTRQIVLGIFFGLVAIGSMHVKIPVTEGVIVDQRNAIVILSAAFGGPIAGGISAVLAAGFRAYLGGFGVPGGMLGIGLATVAGIALHRLHWRRANLALFAAGAAAAMVFTLPGFLFVGDLQAGWDLLKRMVVPWGLAIFVGLFLGGLLLSREDRRQQIEAEKRRSESLFRSLFESAEVAIWNQDLSRVHARLLSLRSHGVADLRGYLGRRPDLLAELMGQIEITHVNQAALKLYGVQSELFFRQALPDLLGADRLDMFLDLLDTIWTGQRGFRTEDSHLSLDGRALTVIMSMPIPETTEEFQNVPVSVLDITERKQAERARDRALDHAERASRAKSEFLAVISHELRTPLNAILGFSEVLVNQSFGLDAHRKYQEYGRHIHASGGMLLDLVNDLLDIAAIEEGRKVLTVEEVPVADAVEDALKIIDHNARLGGLTLENALPAGIPAVLADRRALQQILINLLSNAVKYTPHGGRITVSATTRSGQIELAVADTGQGIPPERLSEVMNPFVRGEQDPYKAQGGWGLGLAISKSLVELHGGDMTIDSLVGVGTRIAIRLPQADCEPLIAAVG